nr:hypothetical protein [Tanacetum cinerariifolium]
MSLDLNYEWEQLLDIDDYDLPLTLVLRLYNSHVCETTITTTTQVEKTMVIIFGHVAKLLKQRDIILGWDEAVMSTQEYMKKVVEDVGEDEDFKSVVWVSATVYVKANGGIVSGCLRDIKNFLKNGKLEQVVTIIKSCTPYALGNLTVTVKDCSCIIDVFSLKPSMHYFNITMKNMVKVFHTDSVSSNGSGVGRSGMLMEEEEIVKLMKEEEMANLELQLMNDLKRNDIIFLKVTINTKFLNSLQTEWLKYVTQVWLAKRLAEDSYDDLFDYLKQFEKLVNASRAKKLEKIHDPLALVAHTGSSSRTMTPYYVTHPSLVVDYDDDYQGDTVQNNSNDPLTSTIILLACAITQNFSNPTNNRLRNSSNIRNQAIVQGDRVRIQSMTSGNDGRNTIRLYVQEEFIEGTN